ncbi:MAG: hypothetical protein EXS09_18645 [Gemmataceae bacterium]|nr:hypothetical protein [Gemmataceae bacterium]
MDTATANENIRQLSDAIYWEKVRRAREEPPIEKLLDGFRLHEYACRITLAGIKNQNPGVRDEDPMKILKDRIAMKRRWDKVK